MPIAVKLELNVFILLSWEERYIINERRTLSTSTEEFNILHKGQRQPEGNFICTNWCFLCEQNFIFTTLQDVSQYISLVKVTSLHNKY